MHCACIHRSQLSQQSAFWFDLTGLPQSMHGYLTGPGLVSRSPHCRRRHQVNRVQVGDLCASGLGPFEQRAGISGVLTLFGCCIPSPLPIINSQTANSEAKTRWRPPHFLSQFCTMLDHKMTSFPQDRQYHLILTVCPLSVVVCVCTGSIKSMREYL